MMRDDVEVVAGDHQRQQRADAGRRQRGQDRDRVDEALVQHAQHDVDGDDRRQDQQQLVATATPGTPRAAPWNAVMKLAGRPMSFSAWLDRVTAAPSDAPGAGIERDRGRRELAEMVDLQRRRLLLDRDDGATAAPARWWRPTDGR